MYRVWFRRLSTDGTKTYWGKMPHADRGLSAAEALVEYYEQEWGSLYEYKITPALDVCKPLA